MAAGLGFKDFTTGEVLTAADVDGYLMQGIWVFASAAARDAAVTSPQEGNFAFLKDTNTTTYYTGSAWTNLDTTGMVNPMTTTGDTIYSSSGSTPARLGIGSTGQVLTVAGGVPTWASPAGGGKVLQVVSATTTTQTDTSSSSYIDSTLTATITPTLNTSKILVMANQSGLRKSNAAANTILSLKLLRDSTGLMERLFTLYTNTAIVLTIPDATFIYLDSPATTSALTYKTQIKSYNGTAEVGVQYNNDLSSIVLLEIGA